MINEVRLIGLKTITVPKSARYTLSINTSLLELQVSPLPTHLLSSLRVLLVWDRCLTLHLAWPCWRGCQIPSSISVSCDSQPAQVPCFTFFETLWRLSCLSQTSIGTSYFIVFWPFSAEQRALGTTRRKILFWNNLDLTVSFNCFIPDLPLAFNFSA